MKYYKVDKKSETGKKLSAIKKKIDKFDRKFDELQKKYGFDNDYYGLSTYDRYLEACVFSKEPDKNIWKQTKKGMWMPKSNTASKGLREDIMSLNKLSVRRQEVDTVIGLRSCTVSCGYNLFRRKYYIYNIHKCWAVDTPDDCTQITEVEYNKING